MPNQKISNQSKDWEYFTVTPQLVWALSRDPYDFTLWNVVKMIAGDNGECYLGTEDLAKLSMMSTGKVSDCRKHLIQVGLLKGNLKKDPGYPQLVWHLQIPDIWKRNIEWRLRLGNKLADRIGWKTSQQTYIESLHLVKAQPSPGEGGPPPGEGGPPPGETKNIQKEQPKGHPASDYLEGIFSYLSTSGSEGIADPNANLPAYWHYRDEALQIYQDHVGSFGRTPQERQTRRDAILGLVSSEEDFDTERWRKAVTTCVRGGVNPMNIDCMIETYHAGGEYKLLYQNKRDGNDNLEGITITPEGRKTVILGER